MPDQARIWRVIVSVLLIVLVLATTMGMVWHHHDRCYASSCTLCHLTIVSPAAVIGAIGLVLTRAEYAVREDRFVSSRTDNEKPSRAPPA